MKQLPPITEDDETVLRTFIDVAMRTAGLLVVKGAARWMDILEQAKPLDDSDAEAAAKEAAKPNGAETENTPKRGGEQAHRTPTSIAKG